MRGKRWALSRKVDNSFSTTEMDSEEAVLYPVLRGALAGWRRIEPVEIEEAFPGLSQNYLAVWRLSNKFNRNLKKLDKCRM
ncbi:hypothetical protein [Burkholderia gladioli]|uniref:hypothetical protein n=1 Tax=Burkholderia gladioli TaxID=28095 RepID=UPI00163FAC46|nr:hypothetical protein [Burkholderia gladioli]